MAAPRLLALAAIAAVVALALLPSPAAAKLVYKSDKLTAKNQDVAGTPVASNITATGTFKLVFPTETTYEWTLSLKQFVTGKQGPLTLTMAHIHLGNATTPDGQIGVWLIGEASCGLTTGCSGSLGGITDSATFIGSGDVGSANDPVQAGAVTNWFGIHQMAITKQPLYVNVHTTLYAAPKGTIRGQIRNGAPKS